MNGWIILLLALALGYFILVNLVLVASLRRMASPEKYLRPRATEDDNPAANDDFRHWAESQGLQIEQQLDYFAVPGSDKAIRLDVWVSSDRQILLVQYGFDKKHWVDIISSLDDRYALVTTNYPDALMMPQPPQVLMEVFTRLDTVEDLYKQHLASRHYLVQRFGVQPDALDKPVPQLLREALTRQAGYIRSLPLWYLKGPWWQLYRARRNRNKSVIELIESLPNNARNKE